MAVIVRLRSPRDLLDLPYPHIVLWHRFDVPLNRDADDVGRSMMRRPTVSILGRRTALDNNELQNQLYQRMTVATAAPPRTPSHRYAGAKRGRESQPSGSAMPVGATRTPMRTDASVPPDISFDTRASSRRSSRPDRLGDWVDSGGLGEHEGDRE